MMNLSMKGLFSLQNKTILVTGASSGIGQGVAIVCSKMGATVILSGRNQQKLNETFAQMEEGYHQIITADLTNHDSVKHLALEIPRLDGIVHCAGVGLRILAKNLSESDIVSVMDANFKGPVLLQQALLNEKKVNKGASIVFLSSIATWSPSIGNSVYSASKGAIASYANCLSLELAPRHIRVNCISPAMVWTGLILQNGIDEEQLKADEKNYPLKRYGTPTDIANLAVFLLSDASSWMTGSNVNITGGVF